MQYTMSGFKICFPGEGGGGKEGPFLVLPDNAEIKERKYKA